MNLSLAIIRQSELHQCASQTQKLVSKTYQWSCSACGNILKTPGAKPEKSDALSGKKTYVDEKELVCYSATCGGVPKKHLYQGVEETILKKCGCPEQ